MKNLFKREVNPIDPNEFIYMGDGITISRDFENEVKRDGNKFAELFGEGVDLLSMVEQGFVLPTGRCKKTNELCYQTTERGKLYMMTQKELQQKQFTMGMAQRISNSIKKKFFK
jgi:hypothetical protein